MYSENYFQIASLEKNSWWYRARRDLLNKILNNFNTNFEIALDAGCGVGSNFEVLKKYSKTVLGIDISTDSLLFCSSKDYDRLTQVAISNFDSDTKFDLIILLDVLEHIEDDLSAVKNLYSHLKKNGVLVISVPAHSFLWNINDIFSHHLRRYSIKEVKRIVGACNLRILKLSYWNQFMFIPVLLYCMMNKLTGREEKPRNNLTIIPNLFNEILCRAVKLENALLMKFGLIIGVSIFCICRKE